MRNWLLDHVPYVLRSRWPLRRFYWQADELAEVARRATELEELFSVNARNNQQQP